jgi:hypothetical protein
MRTINTNDNIVVRPGLVDYSDRLPCWYASFEKAKDRTKAKWTVGVKKNTSSEEYSFKPSKFCKVDDDKVWKRITSAEFAIRLIKLYRDCGKKSVMEWTENGCK